MRKECELRRLGYRHGRTREETYDELRERAAQHSTAVPKSDAASKAWSKDAALSQTQTLQVQHPDRRMHPTVPLQMAELYSLYSFSLLYTSYTYYGVYTAMQPMMIQITVYGLQDTALYSHPLQRQRGKLTGHILGTLANISSIKVQLHPAWARARSARS